MDKCRTCGKKFDADDVKQYISSKIGYERYNEITNKYGEICDSCILGFHYYPVIDKENQKEKD